MTYYTYNDIGVIGKGFVGNAVIKWFGGRVKWYSKEGGDFGEVDKKRIIFLCLPTPYDPQCGFELGALEENIQKLSPGKIIVIKSTVLPGTTKSFAKRYPQHQFLFNPEFLRAKTAEKDFYNPDRQIVGIPDNDCKIIASKILDLLPKAEIMTVCDSNVAEMTKLVGNCFLALKIIFAEQMNDYCKQTGTDYKQMIRLVKFDPRIGVTHLDIGTDGYRGYGGYCFPKDMGAVIWDSESPLLEMAHKLNDYYVQL